MPRARARCPREGCLEGVTPTDNTLPHGRCHAQRGVRWGARAGFAGRGSPHAPVERDTGHYPLCRHRWGWQHRRRCAGAGGDDDPHTWVGRERWESCIVVGAPLAWCVASVLHEDEAFLLCDVLPIDQFDGLELVRSIGGFDGCHRFLVCDANVAVLRQVGVVLVDPEALQTTKHNAWSQ